MKTRIYYMALIACILWVTLPAKAQTDSVMPADATPDGYLPLLRGKRVAVFANHTATIQGQHLVDLLLDHDIQVSGIFSPEHGFRGTASAGEKVNSSVDSATGIPIWSLYDGKSLSPSDLTMNQFDILVADIQDVGLRFYTYYISLARLMAACADHDKPLVILDRPNPNGHTVDGPILDVGKHRSGVGAFPIPVIHGMTLGELMLMANDKGWASSKHCDLTVILATGYTHSMHVNVGTPPSPNLPNMTAIGLYPSLCLFEATDVSIGRGTDWPFQVIGHPRMKGEFTFTPKSRTGAANPPQEGRECHGTDLRSVPDSVLWTMGVDLTYLIDAYNQLGRPKNFLSDFFEKLIGVDYVRTMINQGCSAAEIKARWAEDVARFRTERRPYLLYPEE